jgi:hypothetical protein
MTRNELKPVMRANEFRIKLLNDPSIRNYLKDRLNEDEGDILDRMNDIRLYLDYLTLRWNEINKI